MPDAGAIALRQDHMDVVEAVLADASITRSEHIAARLGCVSRSGIDARLYRIARVIGLSGVPPSKVICAIRGLGIDGFFR